MKASGLSPASHSTQPSPWEAALCPGFPQPLPETEYSNSCILDWSITNPRAADHTGLLSAELALLYQTVP